jgi:general secretion pathway protein K
MPGIRGPLASQRGFALLIVLWSGALLAMLGTAVTAVGRADAQVAANLRGNAVAEAAADGGVFTAIFHLLDRSATRWTADGTTWPLRLPGAAVQVTLLDEHAKVPLNYAPVTVLAVLLVELGADPPTATTLAARIAAWRGGNQKIGGAAPYLAAGRVWGPPERPFRAAEELSLVLGMQAELVGRLVPHVTVFTSRVPSPGTTDPIVARALTRLSEGGIRLLGFDEPPVVTVVATAVAGGGARFTRMAVVRISASASHPFELLDWRELTTMPDRLAVPG